MAKRRKLNMRMAVVLGIAGLFIIAGVAFYAYRNGWYHKLFPRDPQDCLRAGEAALADGDYVTAEKEFGEAVHYAPDTPAKAEYLYRYAKVLREWLMKEGRKLPETKQRQISSKLSNAMFTAVLQDPNHVGAQEMLTDFTWNVAGASGQWTRYIKEADNLLKLKPDDPETVFKRAVAWSMVARAVGGENSDKAIEGFRHAIQLKGDDANYHLAYAQFLEHEERWDQAIAAYEDAISRIPDNGPLRVSYGYLLIGQRRKEEGMEQIRQAIQRDPNNIAGDMALAQQLIADGEMEGALKALENAKQIDDSNHQIYSLMSHAYRVQGETEKSISALRDGLAVIERRLKEVAASAPANNRLQDALKDSRWRLRVVLANRLLDVATTDADAREANIEEVRQLVEGTEWLPPSAGQKEKILGRIAYVRGDLAAALPFLEQSYEILGPDLPLAEALMNVYLRRNLPGKAEEVLDAVRGRPGLANNPRLLLIKAQLEMRYRNLAQAREYVDQVLRGDPANAEALRLQKMIAAAGGQVSVEEMLAGEEVPRAFVTALLDRAASLWAEGRRGEAINLVERIHKRLPENRSASSALLSYYRNAGKVEQAKALLVELKAAYPQIAATLDLQEQLLDETDPNRRFDLELQLADQDDDPVRRAMGKAAVCAAHGRVDRQGEYLQEAYDQDPNNAVLLEQLFRYSVIQENWAKAEELARKAVAMNLDGVGGKMFSAQLLIAKKQYAQAIDTLMLVVNDRPNSKPAWMMLGQCYVNTKDLAKAENAFMTVYKADPAHAPAVIAMAIVTAQQGRTAEHADWVERAYRLAPTNEYVRNQHLVLLESKSGPQEVIAMRERMLKNDPGDLENRARLAGLYMVTKQPAKAEEMFTYLYENAPNKLGAAHDLAAFYLTTGRTADAEKVMAEQLSNCPDKVAAYLTYGQLFAHVRPEQSLNAVNEAIKTDPNDRRGPMALVALRAESGDWSGAAEALGQYLKIVPDDMAARKNSIRYRMRARQLDQAQQELDALLAANPSDADLLTLKGDVALQSGDVPQALEAYEAALQIDANHVGAMVGEAQAYLAQGKTAEVQQALTRAKEVSENPRITLSLAELHLQMGNADMAKLYFTEVLNKGNAVEYAMAMQRLIQIYERENRWQKISELLANARAKFPNNPRYLLAEAEVLSQTGDMAGAVQATRTALQMAPGSQETLRSHLLALSKAGDYNGVLAISDAYKAQSIYGPVETAIRAQALAKLGQIAEADKLFLGALESGSPAELEPIVTQVTQAYGLHVALVKMSEWIRTRSDEPVLYFILGNLHAQNKDNAKAAEAYAKCASLAGDAPIKGSANRELGLAYFQMGKFPEAEKAFLAALEVRENDPTTLNNLAYMYATDMDQADKALPYAAKAVKLQPDNADILDTYGWALAKTGSYAEAQRQLLRAVQQSTAPASTALARYHLGWAYEQSKQFDEALRHYRRADDILSGEPDNPLHKDISEAILRIQNAQTMN